MSRSLCFQIHLCTSYGARVLSSILSLSGRSNGRSMLTCHRLFIHPTRYVEPLRSIIQASFWWVLELPDDVVHDGSFLACMLSCQLLPSSSAGPDAELCLCNLHLYRAQDTAVARSNLDRYGDATVQISNRPSIMLSRLPVLHASCSRYLHNAANIFTVLTQASHASMESGVVVGYGIWRQQLLLFLACCLKSSSYLSIEPVDATIAQHQCRDS